MVKKLLVLLLFWTSIPALSAQDVYMVYQGKELSFYSEFLQDSITVDLQVPQDVRYAGEGTGYPLLILLDRQNATIYDCNLRAVNFLAGAGAQMPQCLIAGIPFRPENRFALTAAKKMAGDTLSGIDRMEGFLFEELIPALEQDFPGINFTIITGHSRTGYLVNQLAQRRHPDFDAALSFSGFLENPGEMQAICEWGQKMDKGNEAPFYFYFTAGSAPEETTYREDFEQLAACWPAQSEQTGFHWKYMPFEHANHTTNYILSLPQALIDLYAPYNAVLNDWLFGKLDRIPSDSALAEFRRDIAALPFPASPTPLHIYSLSSHYLNAGEYGVALDFLDYGMQYYPGEPGFYLYKAEVFLKSGQEGEKEAVLQRFLDVLERDRDLPQSEREELMDWYRGL